MALHGLNKVIIMGFCPNCGSWVDEGDTCTFCGGGSGSSSIDELISYLQRTKFSAWNLKKESRIDEAIKENMDIIVKIAESGGYGRYLIEYDDNPIKFYNEGLSIRNSIGILDNLTIREFYDEALDELKELIDIKTVLEYSNRHWSITILLNMKKPFTILI